MRVPLRVFALALGAAAVLSSAPQIRDPAVLLREAAEQTRSGRPEEAAEIYRELLQRDPGNVTLRMNLAIAEFKASRYSETIRNARGVLESHPDHAVAWLFVGAGYASLNQPSEAVEPLNRALALRPDDGNGRLLLGRALASLGRHAEAAAELRRAGRLLPHNPRIFYVLQRSYAAVRDAALERLDRTAPRSVYWLALAADREARLGHLGRAFQQYRAALALRPDLPGLHAAVADIYERAGYRDWAAVERRRAGRTPPPDCARPSRACDYLRGDLAGVVSSSPRAYSPEALYWTAKASAALAETAAEAVHALGDSAESHELRARALDIRGRNPEAAAEWRRAAVLAPENPALRLALALTLRSAGDHGAAKPLLRRLLDTDLDSVEWNYLYGDSLLAADGPERAIPYLEASLARNPDFAPSRVALGRALLQADRAAEAIPHLEAVVASDVSGERHYQLARAYRIAGRAELAGEFLRRYRDIRAAAKQKTRESGRDYPIVAPPEHREN